MNTTNKWITGVLLTITLLVSIASIRWSYYTYHEVLPAKTIYEKVEAEYKDLIKKETQQEVSGQLSDEITKAKLKSFSEVESSILNKIGSALTAVDVVLATCAIILALFSIIMVTITIITTYRYGKMEDKFNKTKDELYVKLDKVNAEIEDKFNKIEDRLNAKLNDLDQKVAELDKKAEEMNEKYSWVDVLPYILLGTYNQLLEDNIFANRAYEAAISIDRNNVLANYFFGMHYAELYGKCKQDNNERSIGFLVKAKELISKAASSLLKGNSSKGFEHDVIKTDIYNALGSIYGLFGERQQNDQLELEARENFLKSIEYLKKAKELDSSFAKIYTNLGFTYYHLNDYEKAFENFKQAVLTDKHERIEQVYSKGNMPWEKTENYPILKDKLNALADEHFK